MKRLSLGSRTLGAPAPVLRTIAYRHTREGSGRGCPLRAVTFWDDLHMSTIQVVVLFQQVAIDLMDVLLTIG